jgi:hypothetical protein
MTKLLIVSVATLTITFAYRAQSSVGNEPSPVELIFSHTFHVAEQELECTDCHGGAEQSETGLDNLLPSMELCGDCHEVDDNDNCAMCHSDVDNAVEVPRIDDYSQKFSHVIHLSYGFECTTCHEAVAAKDEVEPYILPTMAQCVDCHDRNAASQECLTCHVETDNLEPASHTANWLHAHGDLAQSDLRAETGNLTCATCHDSSFCQDCHEGDNIDRRTHPLNWQFTHSLQAQGEQTQCASCHVETTFCIDCHRDNLVLPLNHRPGWVNRVTGGRHRTEALNDLATCMSCHEENAETICQPCHGD